MDLNRTLVVGAAALVVGALHVYPDLRFLRELGPRDAGIHFIAAVDETSYLSRLAQVLNGNYRLGNAMILEHRDDPFTYAPLPEYVLGTLGRLARLTIVQLDIAATALLPAVVLVLFFLLARELVGGFWLPLVSGLALTLGHYLIAKDSPLLRGQLHNVDVTLPLQFVRPVSPQFHYVVFLLALWLLYRVYTGRGGPATLWAAGVGWGLAFYLNVFFWTFLAVGITFWTALAIVNGERRRWRAGLLVLAIGLAVGAYYFLNAYRALTTAGFDEAALRAGFLDSRRPIVPAVHVAGLLLFGAWLANHWDRLAGRFVLAFLLAGLTCLNQQVLTGRTVQPFHWETQTNKVVLLLGLVLVAGSAWSGLRLWPGARALAGTAGVLVVTTLVAHAVLLQGHYYRHYRDDIAALQEVGPALAWLRRAAPPDAVVLANPAQPLRNELVTTYTGRFTYVSEPFFAVSVIPQREVDERYLVAMHTFGFGEPELQRTLRHNGGSLFFGIHALPAYHQGRQDQLRRHLDGVALRYRRISAGLEALPAASTRKLDYVLARAEEVSALRVDALGQSREVYADARYRILAVSPR